MGYGNSRETAASSINTAGVSAFQAAGRARAATGPIHKYMSRLDAGADTRFSAHAHMPVAGLSALQERRSPVITCTVIHNAEMIERLRTQLFAVLERKEFEALSIHIEVLEHAEEQSTIEQLFAVAIQDPSYFARWRSTRKLNKLTAASLYLGLLRELHLKFGVPVWVHLLNLAKNKSCLANVAAGKQAFRDLNCELSYSFPRGTAPSLIEQRFFEIVESALLTKAREYCARNKFMCAQVESAFAAEGPGVLQLVLQSAQQNKAGAGGERMPGNQLVVLLPDELLPWAPAGADGKVAPFVFESKVLKCSAGENLDQNDVRDVLLAHGLETCLKNLSSFKTSHKAIGLRTREDLTLAERLLAAQTVRCLANAEKNEIYNAFLRSFGETRNVRSAMDRLASLMDHWIRKARERNPEGLTPFLLSFYKALGVKEMFEENA